MFLEKTELAARGESSELDGTNWYQGWSVLPRGTCYMRAILQCLMHTRHLPTICCLRSNSPNVINVQRSAGYVAVECHFTWALHYPGDMIQPCQALAASFQRNHLEDAYEFLMFMYDNLRAEGLPGLHSKVGPPEDQFLRHQLFEG